MVDGRWTTPSGRHGKQSDRMAGQQSETCMTICCYGDVVLFTNNGIKLCILNVKFSPKLPQNPR